MPDAAPAPATTAPVAAPPAPAVTPPPPGPTNPLSPTPATPVVAPKTTAERRKVAFDSGKTKAGEQASATPPAADPKATAAPAAPAPALTDENMKWLRSELLKDPAAAHTFQELLKHKSLPDAFIALKSQKKDVARKEREAQRVLDERGKWEAEKQEWETLKREKPLEAAKRLGLTIRQLAESEAGAEPEEKRQLREMRAELDELKKERTTQSEREQQEQEARVFNDAAQDIGAKYAASKELYPELDRFAARMKRIDANYDVGRNAWNYMLNHFRETGIELDLVEVLSSFNDGAAKFFQDEAPRPPEQKTPEPSERGNGAVKPAEPAAQEAPTSLSSAVTSERATPRSPPANQREARARAWAAAQDARSRQQRQ